MLIGFFFVVCFIASSVGAVVGAGGGVIIKPLLDMVGILPVSTVSFCSGCTVLAMSVCSLIRTRNNGVQLKIKTSTALAVGAVVGGLLGQILFDLVRKSFGNESVLGAIQATCLTIMTVGVLLYVIINVRVSSMLSSTFFAAARSFIFWSFSTTWVAFWQADSLLSWA